MSLTILHKSATSVEQLPGQDISHLRIWRLFQCRNRWLAPDFSRLSRTLLSRQAPAGPWLLVAVGFRVLRMKSCHALKCDLMALVSESCH